MHPLFILLALLAVVFTVRWVKQQPRHKRQHAGFMAAIAGAALLLLIALATGRMSPLVAVVAAAIPMLQRLTQAKAVFDNLRSTLKQNNTSTPVMVTSHLRVEVDPDSGDWSGIILAGRHKGQALKALSFAQLSALLNEYKCSDMKSAELLASYLERHNQHHAHANDSRSSSRAPALTMSEHEARRILGVGETATDDDIVATHRRLMQKIHPDRGGSDYLASQINQAKERLLNKT